MKLLHSDDNSNPYFNLATEEFLLRNLELTGPILFLYVNRPTVVLGKNQNVYEETNLNYCRENDILIARRLTGGGTVYHDEGNLNYAVIAPFDDKLLHNFKPVTEPIVRALGSFGIEIYLNERNDLYYRDYKISGTAQFTNRRNVISHGTLLINSNLEQLSAAIQPIDLHIESKSIQSTRSRVKNLGEILPAGIGLHKIKEKIIEVVKEDAAEHSIIRLPQDDLNEIEKLVHQKYQTREWIIDKSPKFSLRNEFEYRHQQYAVEFKIDKGKIEAVQITGPQQTGALIRSTISALASKPLQKGELVSSLKREQYKCSYHPFTGLLFDYLIQVAAE